MSHLLIRMTVVAMRITYACSRYSRVMVVSNGEMGSTGLESAAEQLIHINFAMFTWDHLYKQ
jgi:hypothetical protein